MKLLSIALAALTFCAFYPSPLTAQSLAEIARKEIERRKTVQGGSPVYTNDDLKLYPVPPLPPPPVEAESTDKKPESSDKKGTDPSAKKADGAQAAGAEAAAGEKQPVKDEAYWRSRIEGARTELARSELFAEALQTRINSLTSDFVSRDDPAQQSVIGNDRQKALAELERVRREIVKLKTEIAKIEEEARTSGVPPGWLR